MKPDEQADAAKPVGQQLLFNWTQSENDDADQPVALDADDAAEIRRSTEPAVVPCPSTSSESHDDESLPPQAQSSHGANSLDGCRYPPNHPWHYTREGDHAPPVPFEAIPPAEDYGCSLERELPKPVAKRIIKARQLLDAERNELERTRARYEDVTACGAEALSRYDREIAYGGNDELARAGTLALLYNQIDWRKGRIACLEQLQSRPLTRSR